MHKYQPRIHIIKKKDPGETVSLDMERSSALKKTFVFPDTVFTTVTAYQNQQVQYFESSTISSIINHYNSQLVLLVVF